MCWVEAGKRQGEQKKNHKRNITAKYYTGAEDTVTCASTKFLPKTRDLAKITVANPRN